MMFATGTSRGQRKNLAGKASKKAGIKVVKKAFTLPEVIVAFSILVMVVTSAVGLLTVVIRTNGDNVSSLVANGLAQESLEAVRMIRDSNNILGLDFDGSKGERVPWGERLFEKSTGGVQYFKLVSNMVPVATCLETVNLQNCLPFQLEKLKISDDTFGDELLANESIVYFQSEPFRYFQPAANDTFFQQDGGLEGVADTIRPTQYHRMIRVEALSSDDGGGVTPSDGSAAYDVIRVSSIVSWLDNNGLEKRLVLTTDLTDWQ